MRARDAWFLMLMAQVILWIDAFLVSCVRPLLWEGMLHIYSYVGHICFTLYDQCKSPTHSFMCPCIGECCVQYSTGLAGSHLNTSQIVESGLASVERRLNKHAASLLYLLA